MHHVHTLLILILKRAYQNDKYLPCFSSAILLHQTIRQVCATLHEHRLPYAVPGRHLPGPRQRGSLQNFEVDGVESILAKIRKVLDNQAGAERGVVRLNAGAAIYVSELTESMEQGVALETEVIAAGKAKHKFPQLT